MSIDPTHLLQESPAPTGLTEEHYLALANRLDRMIELLSELTGGLVGRYFRRSDLGNEDGNGRATIIVPIVPGGYNLVWKIQRITQSTTSTGAPTFGFYVIDSLPPKVSATSYPNLEDMYLADWTNIMPKTIADENNAIIAHGGEIVVGQWQGLSAGAVCKMRLQYQLGWQAD